MFKLLVVGAFLAVVFLHTPSGEEWYDQAVGAVSGSANLAASFINDSNIVNIPDDDTVDGAVIVEDPTAGGGVAGESSGDEFVFGGGDSDGSDNVIDEVVIMTESLDEGAEGNSGAGGSEGNHGGEETISAESILSTLAGNQAVTNASAGSSGGNGTTSSGGGTSVSGDKTRAALLSRGITKLTIPEVPKTASASVQQKAYSRGDVSLLAAAFLVEYPDVADVFFTTDSLTIRYKARARLLVSIPITYPTSIQLKFDEATLKKRVSLSYPWYRFLLWTGVSKSALRSEIDSVITSAPTGGEYDRAAFILKEVSDILTGKRGTLVNSIRTVE